MTASAPELVPTPDRERPGHRSQAMPSSSYETPESPQASESPAAPGLIPPAHAAAARAAAQAVVTAATGTLLPGTGHALEPAAVAGPEAGPTAAEPVAILTPGSAATGRESALVTVLDGPGPSTAAKQPAAGGRQWGAGLVSAALSLPAAEPTTRLSGAHRSAGAAVLPGPSGALVASAPSAAPSSAPSAPTSVPGARTGGGAVPPRYSVGLARDTAEVRAAQRLRHLVFAEEMGATLHTSEPGLDSDAFDAFCDHLVVREDRSGEVVGTYRLLPPDRARAAGGLYAAGEFTVGTHAALHSDLVEVGRSCVHPDHREGAVIGLMWAGIARYLVAGGHNWLAGCCSVPLADGGLLAADVRDAVMRKHLAPPEYRVTPYRPWELPAGVGDADRRRQPLPPLLRGYLRLGAWVCGEPAYDPDFGVADFYILLSLRRTDPRYLRRFLALDSA